MTGNLYLPEEDEAILILRGEKLVEQPWTWKKIGIALKRSKAALQLHHAKIVQEIPKRPRVTHSRASRRVQKPESTFIKRLRALFQRRA